MTKSKLTKFVELFFNKILSPYNIQFHLTKKLKIFPLKKTFFCINNCKLLIQSFPLFYVHKHHWWYYARKYKKKNLESLHYIDCTFIRSHWSNDKLLKLIHPKKKNIHSHTGTSCFFWYILLRKSGVKAAIVYICF